METLRENRQYDIGDIISITFGNRAVSCRVIEKGTVGGTGQTKNGTMVTFKDEDVLWKLGKNGKWPSFVHRAFRGEYKIGGEQNAEAGKTSGVC